MTRVEVLIVGGGMVGAGLAAVLAERGVAVAVVEASAPPAADPGAPPSLRVSALSAASVQWLRVAGAWEALRESGVCPYRRLLVWEGEDDGGLAFDAGALGEESLGHIAENHKIQRAAIEALRASGAQWWCPAQLVDLSPAPGGGVRARLADGRELAAALVVGADGARSRVRALAGIGWHRRPYAQRALVATVRTAAGQGDITWQRFCPDGPQALLPLPGSWASLVWYHRAEAVERLLALDDGDFLAELRAAFPERLGDIAALHERGTFSLALAHAAHYGAPGVALVGDAAHVVHPLAGQGVNLGLLDAAVLAQVLLDARRRRQPLGSAAVLARYQRWRRGDNALMLRALDAIGRGFGVALPGAGAARRALLGALAHSGPLKDWLARTAMGRAGDLPALLRASA